jgi:arylsulfatase
MDQGIGRVLQKLEEQKQLDNTLIFFLSDNGGCAEIIDQSEKKGTPPGPPEGFLSYGIGWANASNTPFRLYKHFVHEGGISTPLIAHWPKGMEAGRRGGWVKEAGHVIDIAPTCLDVAGAEQPDSRNGTEVLPIEGVSLLPALKGQPLRREQPIFWEHEGNRAVRDGKWKLVAKGRRGPWELYDVEADRTESEDLAAAEPERVKRMADQWERWALRTNAKPWPPPRQPPAARARNAIKNAARRTTTLPPPPQPVPAER